GPEGLRGCYSSRLRGIAAEWLTPEDLKSFCPIVNISPDVRYPIMGGTLQRRGGIAKHDYVAWAFARKADAMGVDLIQNCEVTGFDLVGDRLARVQTNRGAITAGKVALCAAGNSTILPSMAGLDLPIQRYPLQAPVPDLPVPVR